MYVLCLVLFCQADISTRDKVGCSALHMAAQSNSELSVRFLVSECGLDVNQPTAVTQDRPLHIAATVDSNTAFLYLSNLQEAHRLVGPGETLHHFNLKTLQAFCVITANVGLASNRGRIIRLCWLDLLDAIFSYIFGRP